MRIATRALRIALPLALTLTLAAPQLAIAKSSGRSSAPGSNVGKSAKKTKADAPKPAEGTETTEERSGPAVFSGGAELDDSQRTAEADRKRDEAIDQLKKIIPKIASGPQKSELLFQLAELWIEKSKYVYFTEMAAHDVKYRAFLECTNTKGAKACGKEPTVQLRQSELYRDEALRLYEQILVDFPTYDRKDEVLFALATNLYEKGKLPESIAKYRDLVTQYPSSKFVGDAYVAMGEHYFKANELGKARAAYDKALEASANEPRVYNFALYKLAWCDYNGGAYDEALARFQKVVERSEAARRKNEVQLKWEALNDMVLTWQKLEAVEDAIAYYKKKTSPERARGYFAKLANKYFADGGHEFAIRSYRILIAEVPNDPKAPAYQSNIVRSYEGLRQRDKVVGEMKVLVANYKPGSAWSTANASNKAALASAYELSEGAMRELVTEYHQEAQKTKEVKTYRLAAQIYKDYLDSFADSDHAYNLRFYYAEILWTLEDWENAAEQYELTYAKDAKGSYSKTAAYNTLLCYEKLVAIDKGELEKVALRDDQKVDERKAKGRDKKTKKVTTVQIDKNVREEAIPKWEQKLVEACDRYATIAAADKRLAADEINVLYKSAFIYYDHKHYTEAAKRFGDIILKWPTDAQAQKAADLSLNILEVKEEWYELARLSRAFYANKKLARSGTKWTTDLAKIVEGAQYKYIDLVVYKEEKNPAKAAPMFRDFVKEFPKSQYAPQALLYAMIIFDEAKQLDQGIAVGEQLLADYGTSEHKPRATLYLANFYQQTAEFPSAAKYYEQYANEWEEKVGLRAPAKSRRFVAKKPAEVIRKFPEDAAKASDALYNAALWTEGLGRYDRAIELYQAYIDRYQTVKNAVPAATLAFNIALIYEKQGKYGKMEKALEKYLADYAKKVSAGDLFFARYRRAMALAKLKKHDESVKLLAQCAKDFPKLKAAEQKELDNLDAYAHARFVLLEPRWKQYQAIKFNNLRTLKADLKKKLDQTKPLIDAYTNVLKIGSADWAIASLTRIGMINQDFARNFVDSPDPVGLDEEQLMMYRSEIENRVFPLEEKAIEAFETALQKSYEIGVYNENTLAAQDALNRFKPGAYGEVRPVSFTGSEFFVRASPAATVDASFAPALSAHEKKDAAEGAPAAPAKATPEKQPTPVKTKSAPKKGKLILGGAAQR